LLAGAAIGFRIIRLIPFYLVTFVVLQPDEIVLVIFTDIVPAFPQGCAAI